MGRVNKQLLKKKKAERSQGSFWLLNKKELIKEKKQ
ncbi:hypothetical protein K151_733 [Proteus hauseri ZMd44]|nr:hypothetical protein K151_733 [Proteus hauseri ZMd44]